MVAYKRLVGNWKTIVQATKQQRTDFNLCFEQDDNGDGLQSSHMDDCG